MLNTTPDSFSDGGRNLDPGIAIESGLRMVSEGVDIIDIGGESTRPYSDPVDASEEIRRIKPVTESLARQVSVPISIDTSKAEVARAALDAGAEIINDVTGLEGDVDMVDVARDSNAGVCVMHMRGTPQTMQDDPRYDDVVRDIFEYLKKRLEWCLEQGLESQRICLDPGIGFGKTHEHNLGLLRNMRAFLELDRPILIGHSRKGFIGKLLGNKEADRTYGTLGVTLAVAAAGMHVVRVHDVAASVQALKLFASCGGLEG
ncbi:MAG: dihydropteroate synthase [Planctomycetota bacterium]